MVSTKKTYLVDDEIGIIQSLNRELFPWAIENNFALATAQTGSEALEMVKDEPEDVALVISDIKMPDMRGSDLLLEVDRLFPDIMTILLTGYAETGHAEGYQGGDLLVHSQTVGPVLSPR